MFSNYDYIELGASPSDEPCVQVESGKDYLSAMREQCKRYRELIRKYAGNEPDGASLIIKSNPHEFGSYLEVVLKYDVNEPQAVEYAHTIEDLIPSQWDKEDEAKYGYLCIVSAQGDEADYSLSILDQSGEDAVIEYLSQWDNGDDSETSEDAPWGSGDYVCENDLDEKGEGYILIYNTRIGYIALYKKVEIK